MSRHYFMAASKNKEGSESEKETPQINRFSDVAEIDSRRHDVLDYLLMGYSEDEIANYIGKDISIIRADVKKIKELGFKARDEDVVQVRDEIMRTYRMAKKEAFRAFRLSQGEVVKVTEETAAPAGAPEEARKVTKVKTTTEVQAGDPRFLTVMIDSAKEMGKVSGAQKHKEFQMQQNINQNNLNILAPNRTKMPEEFNRWTKKPEGESVPTSEGIQSEDL